MRAFQLVAPTKAEVRDVPEPEPGPGEVLLKVTAAGVCHSDLHILGFEDAVGWPTPMTLGHEIAGTVAARGPDVLGWEEGEPVLVNLSWGCGRCRMCGLGADNYCQSYPRTTPPGGGLGRDGGMAGMVVVPARQLLALGDLDPVTAAPLTDAGLTAYHGIDLTRDRLRPGAVVVVIGVGGLGHMGVQILRETTAATIVAVDTDEGRLQQALDLGAHVGLAPDGAAAEIMTLTKGRGADAVVDFVGAQATLDLGASVVATRGQITMVGLAGGTLGYPAGGTPTGLPWGVTVVRPFAGTTPNLREVIALAQQGRIAVHAEAHPLEDAHEVLERLERGEVPGRAVLIP